MTTVQDLQKQFHCCMPLFIALGDKVRLSIVELLTEAAVRSEDPQGTIDFEGHFVSLCFGLGGEKFGLWEFKLFKSECILGDIAFGSMV